MTHTMAYEVKNVQEIYGQIFIKDASKVGMTLNSPAYIVKTMFAGGFFLKDYIEERAVEIAYYIIEHKATVRQTAKSVPGGGGPQGAGRE